MIRAAACRNGVPERLFLFLSKHLGKVVLDTGRDDAPQANMREAWNTVVGLGSSKQLGMSGRTR